MAKGDVFEILGMIIILIVVVGLLILLFSGKETDRKPFSVEARGECQDNTDCEDNQNGEVCLWIQNYDTPTSCSCLGESHCPIGRDCDISTNKCVGDTTVY